MLFQQGNELGVLGGDGRGGIGGGAALLHLLGQDLGQILAVRPLGHIFLQVEGVFVAGQLHGGHFVLLDHLDERRIGDLLGADVGDLCGQKVKEDDDGHRPKDRAYDAALFGRLGAAAFVTVVLIGIQCICPPVPGDDTLRFWFMSFGKKICVTLREGNFFLLRRLYAIIFPLDFQGTDFVRGVKFL